MNENNSLPPIQDIQKLLAVGAETDGAVTLTYPIPAVPHRGRYPLDIRLEYTSTVENGLAGVGWTITNEYIEQVGESYFWIRGAVRHELREDQSTPGVYRAFDAVERRDFTLHMEEGDDGPTQNWEAADELGVTWRYAAQLVVDWGGVIGRRWYIVRVEDSNGNHARFSYVDEETSFALRKLPLLIDKGVEESVLDFFNQVRTADEIVETIKDDPDFGSDTPQTYGVRGRLARRILTVRDVQPGNKFTSINQINAIHGMGPDTLHDTICSITGQTLGDLSRSRVERVPVTSIPAPYLDTITYNHDGDTAYNRLRFEWHDRNDSYYDHISDVAFICTKILRLVYAESLVDDDFELHRRVVLSHLESEETGRSLLYLLTEAAPSSAGHLRSGSLRLNYTQPLSRSSNGAFATPTLEYDAPAISVQTHYRNVPSSYPDIFPNSTRYATHNSYIDLGLFDYNADGVLEIIRTHQLDPDGWRWQVQKALPGAAAPSFRTLYCDDKPIGLRYHGTHPIPISGDEGNNWQIFSIARQILLTGYRQMLSGFVEFWRGAPPVLVQPYRFWERYDMVDSNGNFVREEETLINEPGRWLYLAHTGSQPGAMFDAQSYVNVDALSALAGRNGQVPLQEFVELQSLHHYEGQSEYTDTERGYVSKFVTDIDGDGVAEYVCVRDDGATWLVAKLEPPHSPGPIPPLRFSNFETWSLPSGVKLLPYLETTEVQYNDPMYTSQSTVWTGLVDVTGNGRLDFIEFYSTTGKLQVWLNNGRGFVQGPSISHPYHGEPVVRHSESFRDLSGNQGPGSAWLRRGLLGVDMSGLPHAVELQTPASLWIRHLHADRWAGSVVAVSAHADFDWRTTELFSDGRARECFRFQDLWADGRIGALVSDGTKTAWYKGVDCPPDLLAGIDNNLGHEVAFEYALAGDFLTDSYRGASPLRCFNTRPVCTRVRETEGGSGIDRQLAFWYSDPIFDDAELQIKAFNKIDRFDSLGTVIRTSKYIIGNTVIPWRSDIDVYHDPDVLGRLTQQSNLFEVVREYRPSSAFLGTATKYRDIVLDKIRGLNTYSKDCYHDGVGGMMSSVIHMQYNGDGFLSRHETELEVRELDYLTTPGFRGLVSEERSYSVKHSGRLVRRTRNYYDEMPLGCCLHNGNLTRTETEFYTTGHRSSSASPVRTAVSTFTHTDRGLISTDTQFDVSSHAEEPVVRTERHYDEHGLWVDSESVVDLRGDGTTLTRTFAHDPVSHGRTTVTTASGAGTRTELNGFGQAEREFAVAPDGTEYLLLERAFATIEDERLVVEERAYNQHTRTDATPDATLLTTKRTIYSGTGQLLQTKLRDHLRNEIVAVTTRCYDRHGRLEREIGKFELSSGAFYSPDQYMPYRATATMRILSYDAFGQIEVERTMQGAIEAPTSRLKELGRTEFERCFHNLMRHTTVHRYLKPSDTRVSEETWVDAYGRVVKTKDGEGQVVDMEYDLAHNLLHVSSGGSRITFERDAGGKIVSTLDSETGRTTRSLDSFGNTKWITVKNNLGGRPPTASSDALVSLTTDVHWVSIWQILSGVLECSDRTEFSNRFILERREFGYSGGDWIIDLEQFLWDNRTDLSAALPAHLHSGTANPLMAVFEASDAGREAWRSLWMATQHNTHLEMTYDHLNRITEEAVMKPEAIERKGGWLVSHVKDAAQTVQYRYDTYSDTTTVPDDQHAAALGNLTEISSTDETIELAYDWLGSIAQKNYLRGGSSHVQRLVKDLTGNLHEVQVADARYAYQYVDGLLSEVQEIVDGVPVASLFTLGRDDAARVDHVDTAAGVYREHDDILERVESSISTAGATVFSDYVEVDSLGRISHRDRSVGGVSSRRSYIYDGTHRATQITSTPLGVGGESWVVHREYRKYDAVNNLRESQRTVTESGANGLIAKKVRTSTFEYAPIVDRPHMLSKATVDGAELTTTYEAQGRLISVLAAPIVDRPHMLSKATVDGAELTGGLISVLAGAGQQGVAFKYDARGRVTRIDVDSNNWRALAYDVEGRLRRITGPGVDLELFGQTAFVDHTDGTLGVHLSADGVTLVSQLRGATSTRLISYRIDVVGDIVAAVEGESEMAIQIDDDLAFAVNGALMPMLYLPAASRGGRLFEVGGWQFVLFGNRLFIPRLQMFTRPDPYHGALAFPNAYNRYSFGYNALPNASDPTGYFVEALIFGAVIGAVVGALVGLQFAGWQGALIGAGIGVLVGLISSLVGVATTSALGGTGGAKVLGWGLKEAIVSAVRGGTVACFRNRNVALGIVAGAFIGFTVGALEGCAQNFDVFSLGSFGFTMASQTFSGGLTSVMEGKNFWEGVAFGAIAGVVFYTFKAMDTFFSDYESITLNLIGNNNNYSAAMLKTKGDLMTLFTQGAIVNSLSRGVAIGLAVAVPIYLATDNWGYALIGFAGATVVMSTAVLLDEGYVLGHDLAGDMSILERTGSDTRCYFNGTETMCKVQWGRFYGLVPVGPGTYGGGILYFSVEVPLYR